MKKLVSLLLALMLIASLFTGTMMTASAGTPALTANFDFYAVSYSPVLDTYVAVARNTTTNTAEVYTSTDMFNWTKTLTASNTANSANPTTNQIIVWWEAQSKFVLVLSGTIYSSANGLSWTAHTLGEGLNQANNLVLETNGTNLIMSGGARVRVFSTLSNPIVADDLCGGLAGGEFITLSGQLTKAIGISSTTPEKYMMLDQYYIWSKTGDAAVSQNSGTSFNLGSQALGMAYVSKYDKWLVTSNTTTLRLASIPNTYTVISDLKLENNTNNAHKITTAAVSDSDIVLGTDVLTDTETIGGQVYYIPHTDTVANADTVWSVASPKNDTPAISEKIYSIRPAGANRFIMATATKIYIIEKTNGVYKYEDINNIFKISNVNLKETNFNNVALTSIVYSPEKDLYVAVGRDTTKPNGEKGVIYTSEDGNIWNLANISSDNLSDLDQTAGQGLVWWKEAGSFVIRAGAKILFSKNGFDWALSGDLKADGITATGGSLYVAGGNLYEANGTSNVNVYTVTNEAAFPAAGSFSVVNHTLSSSSLGFNRVASDGNGTILTSYGYTAYIKGSQVTGTIEDLTASGTSWKSMTNINGTANVSDIIYSENQQRFIITKTRDQYTTGNPLAYIDKTGAAGGITHLASFHQPDARPTTVETNNTILMIGTEDGLLYYAPDSTNITTWTKVAYTGDTENKLKIQSLCKGKDDRFYAVASNTASNGSDILIIEADGSSYQRINDKTVIALSANTVYNAVVETTYAGEEIKSNQVIVAIYNDKQLVYLSTETGNFSKDSSYLILPIETNDDVTASSTMKIMIWDSLEGMKPDGGAYDFFQ